MTLDDLTAGILRFHSDVATRLKLIEEELKRSQDINATRQIQRGEFEAKVHIRLDVLSDQLRRLQDQVGDIHTGISEVRTDIADLTS